MSDTGRVPTISIVGTKNSGKTTLLVALAAELRRRGRRVASMKHGHHAFEIDREGTDSWRHFHEGEVEAVLFVSSDRVALVSRATSDDADPERLIGRYYADKGYDLVLVEGFKHGPFPKIEVYRKSTGGCPIYDASDPAAAALFLAIVTDDAGLAASCPVITLGDDPGGPHVAALADLLADLTPKGASDA